MSAQTSVSFSVAADQRPAAESRALARHLAFIEDLSRAEPAALRAHQERSFQALDAHFRAHSAWYLGRRRVAGLPDEQPLTLDRLASLSPISRSALQTKGETAFAASPREHGAVQITQTSGSSGEPVRVARTALSHQFWMAYGVREHLWFKRDLSRSLLVIRANLPKPFLAQKSWGPPVDLLTPTGPGFAASLSLSTAELAGLVSELQPTYALLYPSVLRDLLREFDVRGRVPVGLRQIRSMGETLPPDLREAVKAAWNVETVDTYSSQELGVIAIQCPNGDGYHVMAENLLVEVIRADGSACTPGETGQVVITDLHNFATPLIRYAVGDLAEAGGHCRCGRGLPMVRAIRGRLRNLITYPGGERRWPLVGFAKFRDIAPIAQYQVVQRAIDLIELKLVCQPLSPKQEEGLRQVMRSALGHPFPIDIVYHPEGLPRQANGKHEEVISLVSS